MMTSILSGEFEIGMSETKRPIADTILIALTLLLLVLLPLLLETSRDREWGYGLFITFVALLTGGWAFTQAARERASTNRAWPFALPMIGLLCLTQIWVGAQLYLGITADPGVSVRMLGIGIAYTLLFTLICGLFHTRKRLTLLITVLIASATLQAFYGTLMTLSGIEWKLVSEKEIYRGVATGTFYNRNHLAGYLEMALGLGIGLLLAMRDNRAFKWRHLFELIMGPKARLRLALVIMVIALVMTRSRMGNTGFFVSLIVVGGLYVLLNKENRKRNILILVSIVVIDVLVISQYFGLDQLKDRLVNTRFVDQTEVVVSETGEETVRTLGANEIRDDINVYAWPQFLEKPITGFGAGTFESTFQKYPGPDVKLKFDHAHNDYMEFAIEYGIIGLIPLTAFVLFSLYMALKALWNRNSWYRSGIGFGSSMGIIAILVHATTEFNFQIPANAATFITLCAIAVLANTHTKTKQTRA